MLGGDGAAADESEFHARFAKYGKRGIVLHIAPSILQAFAGNGPSDLAGTRCREAIRRAGERRTGPSSHGLNGANTDHYNEREHNGVFDRRRPVFALEESLESGERRFHGGAFAMRTEKKRYEAMSMDSPPIHKVMSITPSGK